MKATFDDFMTKAMFEKAAKMELYLGEEKTDQYFMVKGLESPELNRARVTSQVNYKKLADEIKTIEDDVEKVIREREGVEDIQIIHACELIDSWSFDEECNQGNKLKILSENSGLAALVIGFSAEVTNYRKKK